MRRAQAGFSLIELLVVTTVIGVMMAIIVVSFQVVNQNARNTKRRSDLAELRGALESYRLEKGTYPETDVGIAGGLYDISADGSFLEVLSPNFKSRMYADPLPQQSSEYQYRYRKHDLPGCAFELGAFLEGDAPGQPCPEACGVSVESNYYCLTE